MGKWGYAVNVYAILWYLYFICEHNEKELTVCAAVGRYWKQGEREISFSIILISSHHFL